MMTPQEEIELVKTEYAMATPESMFEEYWAMDWEGKEGDLEGWQTTPEFKQAVKMAFGTGSASVLLMMAPKSAEIMNTSPDQESMMRLREHLQEVLDSLSKFMDRAKNMVDL